MNWTIGGIVVFAGTFFTGYAVWRIIYWVFITHKYKTYLRQFYETSETDDELAKIDSEGASPPTLSNKHTKPLQFIDFIQEYYEVDTYIKITNLKSFRFLRSKHMYFVVNLVQILFALTLGVILFIIYLKINGTEFGVYLDIPF